MHQRTFLKRRLGAHQANGCLVFPRSHHEASESVLPKHISEARRSHCLTEISQSAGRRPWTSAGGVLRCLSTSSTLFSFSKRRTSTGLEHLGLLGFVGVNSNGLTQSQLRNLAGEAMSLPQIALVEAALLAAALRFFGPV